MAELPMREAARQLLRLRTSCPDLFDHVLPLSEEDLETLREIAFDDPEETQG